MMGSRHLVKRQTSDRGPYLLMHRVVQKHILSRLEESPDEFQQVFDAAYRLIVRVFPKQSPIQIPQNDLWEQREVLSPHVLSLCVIFDNNQASLPSVGIEFAEMLTDASSYFWERGLYKEGYQNRPLKKTLSAGETRGTTWAVPSLMPVSIRSRCISSFSHGNSEKHPLFVRKSTTTSPSLPSTYP